jgi:hypothetical protein
MIVGKYGSWKRGLISQKGLLLSMKSDCRDGGAQKYDMCVDSMFLESISIQLGKGYAKCSIRMIGNCYVAVTGICS